MVTVRIARRYFVSGIVQGVGFRYFTQDEAERLQLSGFVRNLRDGRVEVYAIGSGDRLARLRTLLERGPRGAMVQKVAEQAAEIDTKFADDFSITYDSRSARLSEAGHLVLRPHHAAQGQTGLSHPD